MFAKAARGLPTPRQRAEMEARLAKEADEHELREAKAAASRAAQEARDKAKEARRREVFWTII